MNSEILTELKALSEKVDTMQSEISQLFQFFVDHLSICKRHDSKTEDLQNMNSGESVTHYGDLAKKFIEHEAPVADHDQQPRTGICTVSENDEEQDIYSQNCSAEGKHTCLPGIHSKENPLHGRTAKYSHSLKECREECLRKAIQQNIVLLVDNLPYSENDILDMLIENECLTETECSDLLNNGSRKDRVRNLVRTIKGRTFTVIKMFVESVKKLHPEVAASIWKAYDKIIKDKKNYNRQCAFCTLKKSVDIKFLADHIWSIGAMSDELYDEIVDGRTDKETLWTKLADEYNVAPSIIRQKALRKVTEALMKMGLYRELVFKLCKISFLKCACITMDVNSVLLSLSENSGSLRHITSDCDEITTASPMSTPRSSLSFADGTDIISDDDDFPVNEIENFFSSPWSAENDMVLRSSCLGLRKASIFAQGTVLPIPRSHSFGRGSFQSLDKRRASMFT